MSEPVAPPKRTVHAFPRPQGQNVPARIFEHDEVITGEAVALKIQPAGPVQLLAAGGIDLFVGIIVALTLFLFLLRVGPLQETGEAVSTYLILSLVVAFALLPAVVETATRGRSLGKWILGVQIVRDDGGGIRFRHSIARSLVGLFEILMTFGSIALITTIANARHKRLGDLLAGTYPVSLNVGAILAPPLQMPPELARWAAQTDATRLPGALAWRARQFLNTAHGLDPAHRGQIAAGLAAEVHAFVSMPPPPNTNPERFLAAVLVIRRDAEYLTDRRTQESIQARIRTALPYGLSGPEQP